MKRFSAYVIFLVVLVVLVTLAAVIAPEPEEVEVVSDDGILTLTGVARASQPFSIDLTNNDGGGLLENTFYVIEPRGIGLEVPAVLTFDVSSFEGEVDVFWYDEDFMMWREVAADQASESAVTITTDRLGSFVLGSPPAVIAPTFAHQYDSLLEMAPDDVVGFEMASGFSIDDSSTIFINDSEQFGGCAGTLGRGNLEERTALDQDLVVPVEDVDQLVTFSFMAEWYISSGGGCEEGENLEVFSGS